MDNLFIKTDKTYKYIYNPIFKTIPPNFLSLSNYVLVYNDSINYKIIARDIVDRYPIIYDKYYDKLQQNNAEFASDITISYCPFTSASVIYFGKLELSNELYNNNVILIDKKNPDYKIIQLKGDVYSKQTKKIEPIYLRRTEIKIMTLRNALTMFPDCLYLHINLSKNSIIKNINNYHINKEILYPLTNKSEKYHPKTLIYGIEYESTDINKTEKHTMIIGKKDKNFDYQKNGFDKYFDNMLDKIRDKAGIIIPCYYFSWYSMYPNSKIIHL